MFEREPNMVGQAEYFVLLEVARVVRSLNPFRKESTEFMSVQISHNSVPSDVDWSVKHSGC